MFEGEPICYEAVNTVTETPKKKTLTCWRVPSVVILVQTLNMHGNSEGVTGLYSLSSIEEVALRGER